MKKQLLTPLLAFFFFAITIKSEAQWNLTGNANATTTSILGTTNAIPLYLTTNNVQRLIIDASGKVGIGISAPPNIFCVKGSGGVPNSVWVNSGNPLFTGFGEQTIGNADYILSMASTLSNARPVFIGRRSKGTLAAPLSLANNDYLMSFLSSGYDGTAFQNAAAIDFYVDGTPAAGSVPTRISFVTGSNSGNRAERLKIGNTGDISMNTSQLFVQKTTGNVGIGNILPQAKLDVAGQVKITGGAPAAGKVLTSDSAGLASWQAIPSVAETDPKVGSLSLNKVPKWNGSTLVNSTITDNGNVGIGEANPIGVLHVSQPGAFAGVSFAGSGINDLSTNISGYNTTGANSYVVRINNPGPTPNLVEISNDGGATFSAPVAIVNPLALAYGVTATFAAIGGHTFGDQWAWTVNQSFSNILVAKDGKVGIGTTSPAATMDIAGNIKISGGSPAAGKVLTSDTAGLGSWSSLTTLETDPQVAVADTSAVPRWNGTALVTGTLTDNGTNVGIGTTNPTAKLEVNGDALINGITAGRGSGNDSSNTVFGFNTLDTNTTGIYNAAFGNGALRKNTTGRFNTAIGAVALTNNTTGDANTANGYAALARNVTGEANTANGESALHNNTIGSYNTGNGFEALYANTTGQNNTANGAEALHANTTGEANTANGKGALYSNTNGSFNTANGQGALYANSTGYYNTATGVEALSANTNAFYNTANGHRALFANTIGSYNTATGASALESNVTGNYNAANGSGALANSTTGNRNTANGATALIANTTGYNNTANGAGALYANTTGYANTANGESALRSNTSGYSNVAVGIRVLYKNTTGSNLVAVGDSALFNMNGGFGLNTALGSKTLFANTSGAYNTAAGNGALTTNTTGSLNTAFGKDALTTNTTGSNNTALGYDADVSTSNLSTATAIGYNATVNASNKMQLGSSTTTLASTGGITIVSDGRFKDNVNATEVPGLAFINNLKPVAYNFNYKGFDDFLRKDMKKDKSKATDTGYQQLLKTKGETREVGFIAQEVNNLVKDKGYTFNGVYTPQNENDNYALDYSRFVVPLVKAVQELSKANEQLTMDNGQLKAKATNQQKVNEELKKAKAEQETRIAKLEAMMLQMMNSKSSAPCPPLAGQ